MRQRGGCDCGPAALATVAEAHGCTLDYDDVREHAATDRGGVDLLTLSRLAERFGLSARGIETSYDAIRGCGLPAIAHVRRRFGSGHFVVVHQWARTHVVIADPASGLRTLSRQAFCRRWTGHLLVVRPTPPSEA